MTDFSQAPQWAHLTAVKLGVGSADPRHDDCVQEGLLRLVKAAPTFDPARMAWRSFAIMVLRRAIIDFLRYTQLRSAAGPPADVPAPERVCAEAVLEAANLPRLYRRAVLAGSVKAVCSTGLPLPAAERIVRCSRAKVFRALDDRP